MKFWRPPVQYGDAHRKWYDTSLCRRLVMTGLMAELWVKHFFPTLGFVAANDTDHANW